MIIVRLLLLIALPIVAYSFVKSLSKRFAFTPRQNRILFLIVATLLVVGVLIALGRLPVQFILAPLGAAAAFIVRFLPTLVRLLPMWQLFSGRMRAQGMGEKRRGEQSSTIRTAYLAMELQHSNGAMDGTVLEGQFSERKLSQLNVEELLTLYEECRGDADSAQVLQAYLQREHPDWQEQVQREMGAAPAAEEGVMTRTLALEILGLTEPLSKEAVSKAHRQLMQKLHPDRGGSDYLATKINLAKDFLLQELD